LLTSSYLQVKIIQLKIFDFHKVIEAFNGFIETKVEILKLDAREEIGTLIAKLLVLLLIGLFSALVLLFLSLACAYALNDVLESTYAGLLIVGGFYLVISIVLYSNRKKVIHNIVEKQRAMESMSNINEEEK
jgi:uncharacterized membrane protein YqjE